MSILGRMWRGEKRSLSVVPQEMWRGNTAVGGPTSTGITVTPDRAMQSTAVFACVRVIAESIASLPLILYERLPSGKRRAVNHPLYPILHDLPNPEMTRVELWEALVAAVALRGNGYAYIDWGRDGHVRELWPILPTMMNAWRDNGQPRYMATLPNGENRRIDPVNIMHLRGLGDGWMGLSPIGLAKQAVGLSLAAEEFGATFYGNNARPGGVLMHPGVLGDEAHKHLKNSWESAHGGLAKSHKTAILEEGMRYEQIGINPDEAQFLETRKFQVVEIARMFRVPPHMIADLERATFGNIEQQSLEFVMYSLRPWLVRLEQAGSRDLLLPSERKQFYMEHLVDGLLRGAIQDRYNAYGRGLNDGWLTPNEVRERENMNPFEGGDVFRVPMNMMPSDQFGQQPEEGARAWRALPHTDVRQRTIAPETAEALTPAQRQAADGRHALSDAMRPLLADVLRRVQRRAMQDVGGAAKKYAARNDMAAFEEWLPEFWEQHTAWMAEQLRPTMGTYAELVGRSVGDETGKAVGNVEGFVVAYVNTAASRHVARQQARLDEVLAAEAEGDWGAAVAAEAEQWPEEAEGMANEEAVRGNNALAVAMYVGLGFGGLRWVSFGDTCPFCSKLDGRTSGITVPFLLEGTEFEGVGGVFLPIKRSIGHPPAHRGCDCMVVAV